MRISVCIFIENKNSRWYNWFKIPFRGHIKMKKEINKKLNKPQELLIEMLENIYKIKK